MHHGLKVDIYQWVIGQQGTIWHLSIIIIIIIISIKTSLIWLNAPKFLLGTKLKASLSQFMLALFDFDKKKIICSHDYKLFY